jgi:hypothetical protein
MRLNKIKPYELQYQQQYQTQKQYARRYDLLTRLEVVAALYGEHSYA